MKKERKNWKDNDNQVKEVFELLANIRGKRKYKNSVEWIDHCNMVANILSNKYKETITSNQIQALTILPNSKTKIRYAKQSSKTLAYAILSGWLIPEYLNDLIEGKMSFAEKKYENKMKKGIIKNISNDISSGLQTITFEDGKKVLIENYGIRVLADVLENPIGETLLYDIDENNIMTSFDFEDEEEKEN